MTAQPHCWRCNAELVGLVTPLARHDKCPACLAPLHVCRMCRHYDTSKSNHCREPVAEPVRDKTRANFCDWFQARVGAWATAAGMPAGASAKAALDALFSGAEHVADAGEAKENPTTPLDDLFKP